MKDGQSKSGLTLQISSKMELRAASVYMHIQEAGCRVDDLSQEVSPAFQRRGAIHWFLREPRHN